MDYENSINLKQVSRSTGRHRLKKLQRLTTIDCGHVTSHGTPDNHGLTMTSQLLIKKVSTDNKGTTYKRKKLSHSKTITCSEGSDIKYINTKFKSIVLTPKFKALVNHSKQDGEIGTKKSHSEDNLSLETSQGYANGATSQNKTTINLNGFCCTDVEKAKHSKHTTDSNFKLQSFIFLKTLGTGTFGRVYLTQNTSTSTIYAMKVLRMSDVVKQNQIEHVNSERQILLSINHPYIVNLLWTCRDLRHLYMLFEFVPGGELFSYLRDNIKLNADQAVFYVAEIICVFEYLHDQHIVYRDLKTENLLIARDGHLKFTDFGFSKYLPEDSLLTYTLCGTPEYLSPECIQGRGYDYTCDWWALGILTYEMLVGDPPFVDSNPFVLYQKIISGIVKYPDYMENTPEKNFIEKLLVVERSDRLGRGKNGIKQLKSEEWIQNINWEHANNKLLTPPFIPDISSDDDTTYFDDFDETWPDKLGSELTTQKTLKRFENWPEDFA